VSFLSDEDDEIANTFVDREDEMEVETRNVKRKKKKQDNS
jgi:hypothetical protein